MTLGAASSLTAALCEALLASTAPRGPARLSAFWTVAAKVGAPWVFLTGARAFSGRMAFLSPPMNLFVDAPGFE